MEGNTLTMESNVETTSLDNLSADEQDSLAVGEKMQEAQENLLAGKYKSAEELEKGYLELQQKLNTNKTEPAQEEVEEVEESKTAKVESNILDQLWDESGTEQGYTKETLDQLRKMSVDEIAEMHLDYRNSTQEAAQNKDFSEANITELKNVVGGAENYSNMINWAQGALNETEVNMFDAVMAKGDPLAAFFAVRALGYAYNDAVGYDGKMVQGKAPKQSNDQFRSQQEVVRAMADPRYEEDPAYRRDIMEKLERSPNVNF
jgi:hypothetical protein